MSLVDVNLSFLGVAIILYCLLAGADFGAGILELFVGREKRSEQRELITHAIAPVWEANHVWLILALVILFNGFPRAFAAISTVFHIPLTLMLLGVVLRGCAFTFRHYDAIKDRSQNYYTAIFTASSVLAPFFLGAVAGGIILGRAPLLPSDFHASFVAPWLNLFCASLGVFVCVLFTFLAAVYLIGETADSKLRSIFIRRARITNLAAVWAGAMVFVTAHLDGLPLARRFLDDPISLTCMILATAVLLPLWRAIHHSDVFQSRILGAGQVMLVLLGWFKLQYPTLITLESNGSHFDFTILNSAAPQATQLQLLYALLAGCAVIFPALFFLFRIFKLRSA